MPRLPTRHQTAQDPFAGAASIPTLTSARASGIATRRPTAGLKMTEG